MGAEYENAGAIGFPFSSNFMAAQNPVAFATFTASLASSFLFVLVCFLMGLLCGAPFFGSAGSPVPRLRHGLFRRLSLCLLRVPRRLILFSCAAAGLFSVSARHHHLRAGIHSLFLRAGCFGRSEAKQGKLLKQSPPLLYADRNDSDCPLRFGSCGRAVDRVFSGLINFKIFNKIRRFLDYCRGRNETGMVDFCPNSKDYLCDEKAVSPNTLQSYLRDLGIISPSFPLFRWTIRFRPTKRL